MALHENDTTRQCTDASNDEYYDGRDEEKEEEGEGDDDQVDGYDVEKHEDGDVEVGCCAMRRLHEETTHQ